MEQLFSISEYQNCFILRCDAGARQDIFDEAGVPCTGPIIEAVVFYFCELNETEEFPIEFDSDLSMFAAYSEDKRSLQAMADMLNRSFADDDALKEALASDDVQESVMLENSLNAINGEPSALYKSLGLDSKGDLSPEEIAGILGKLF